MQVKDGMSEITLTVGPSHTLREAAQKMVEKGHGSGTGDRRTSCRLLRSSPSAICWSPSPAARTRRASGSADHMSEGVLSAAPDWSLERAAAEMSRRNVRHLVVFDGGDPVGVLSMRDIVRCWTSDGATSEMQLPG